MLPLPEHPFECDLVVPKASGKTPYLRFDRNDYSIPPELVRKPVTLIASHDTVRVLDRAAEVARHARCYDRRQVIEDPRHIAALVAYKHEGRAAKGRDRLLAVLPHAEAFFVKIVEREVPLAQATAQLTRLLDDYGAIGTDAGLQAMLARDTPSLASVALWLEQERRKRHPVPRVPLALPDRPEVRDLRVTPHDLERYDALTNSHPPEQDDDEEL